MDSSKVHQSQVHENDEQHPDHLDSQQVMTHGEKEEHHSVMSKVKAKARSIKDSIKKHYGKKEHQHTPDHDHDLDIEEDKEMFQDPQVHEAPIYESGVVKSAATPASSQQVENLDKSGIDLEGTKVMGEEESHHDSLVDHGVSSATEINQKIDTHPATTFAEEERQEQYEVNLGRPIVSEEDPHEQGSRSGAYTLPNYQTKVTDPSGAGGDEIKDITAFEKSLERMNVHNEPKPTTEPEIQSNVVDTEYPHPTKTFAAEEKQEQSKVSLERPVDLEENPHELGSRPDAYTLPNYQTKVTNPSGAGSDEIEDITAVEESFERMNVQDEPKPTTESKFQSTVADTEYLHPAKTFAAEEKKEQRKVNFERPVDLEEDPHEQGSRPDTYALPNYQTKVTNPSGAGSDEGKDITAVEESFERMNVQDKPKPTTEPEIQSNVADTEYPPAGSHVPHLSAATETQNEYPQETVSSNINRNPEIDSSTGQTFNITTTVEKQPLYESGETQSKEKSYIDETEISYATGDETLSIETDEASKLGYDEKGERNDGVKTHEEEQEESGNGFNKVHSLTENLAPVYGSGGGGVETETKNVVKDHDDKEVSVKDNLAEKPSPGEEDKALSELNSEALHEPKEEPEKKKDGELGSGDEKSEKLPEEIHVNSPEKGMVDKFKGYVGSWFSTSDENQSPQVAGGEDLSKNKNYVAEVEQVSPVVDEPRKHE